MSIALVSTFAHALPVLAYWVAHHRTLGVERFYLFVDRAEELAGYAALPLGDGVHLIPRDAALQAEWEQLPGWPYHSQFSARQVYARQCLNTDVAMRRARAAGCDWLIHIDLDECLHIPEGRGDLATFFGACRACDMVSFVNHEAVPEQWHVGNYFAEVTLFKRNGVMLDEAQRAIVKSLFGERYFLAYGNGKSAVNLRGAATEADGVHGFRPAPTAHFERDISVLHYTNCGFNWYHQKFAALGNYDDFWLGIGEIAKLFPIMEESRRAMVGGDIHRLTQLYEQQLMRQGGLPHALRSLIEAGVLMRIGEAPLQTI